MMVRGWVRYFLIGTMAVGSSRVASLPLISDSEEACKAYICMLGPAALKDSSCKPYIANIDIIFEKGYHIVTCSSKEMPRFTVFHYKAGMSFCRPDFRREGKRIGIDCSALGVIDFWYEGKLYTRQWRMNPAGTVTEYYEGKAVPTYVPELK